MTEPAEAQAAANIATLRNMYAALNAGDIPSVLQAFDADIEWTETFPGGGHYSGIAAVEALLSRTRATWAEGACTPVGFRTVDDNRIVIDVHVRVLRVGATDWIDAHVADVYTFRHGKAVDLRVFGTMADALASVGLSE